MPSLELPTRGSTRQCLVVLLPGRWDRPGDFVEQGFPDLMEEAGLAIDMVAVDAHLGYYQERTVLERLREDINQQVREQDYGRAHGE